MRASPRTGSPPPSVPRPGRSRRHGDFADPGERGARINLLNWDGKGRPPGLFPPPKEVPLEPGDITGHSRPEPAPTLEEKR
jgi:nitrate reductase / nitrite oxidoreductase, beta subunit